MLKKLTVAVLACLTLFLSKRSMLDGQPRRERSTFSVPRADAQVLVRSELAAQR